MTTLELGVGDPRLTTVLEQGRLPGGQVALLQAAEGGVVRFALVPPDSLGRPSTFAVWRQAIRAISLTATFTPCLAALLVGLAGGQRLHAVLALCAALGAVVLQVGVNLLNDAEDHRRLIDRPGGLGGAGVIQRGWLSAHAVRRAAHGCFIAGLALGVPALVAVPGPMLLVGVVAAIGALGYSGRPFSLKYRALGDLTVVALCGPVLTAGMSLAAFGNVAAPALLVGLAFGLMALGILHTNNLQDIDDDRRSGAITVASLLGRRAGRVYLVAIYALALLAWVAGVRLAALPWWVLLGPALALPVLLPLVGQVLRAPDLAAPPLALIRVRAAQAHLAFGVGACVALGLGLALG